jgi:hypothetical protein
VEQAAHVEQEHPIDRLRRSAAETGKAIDAARLALWRYECPEQFLPPDIEPLDREEAREVVAKAAVKHAALVTALLSPGSGDSWPTARAQYHLEAAKAFLIVYAPFTRYDRLGFAAFADRLEGRDDSYDESLGNRLNEAGGGWPLDAYAAWLQRPMDEIVTGQQAEPERGTLYALTQEALGVLSRMDDAVS